MMNDDDIRQLFRKLSAGYWLAPQKAKEVLKKILCKLRQNSDEEEKES